MSTSSADSIRFTDGAAYERYMGQWSRLVGTAFLEWLMPRAGLEWLDVGCGSGAFTELVFERYAPAALDGVDPSEEQLAFARTRPSASLARFTRAGAESLPFEDVRFDVAVMPLVLHFVPDPARGVAEMARVVRPGGIVAAYVWDMEDGGFPYAILLDELRAMGINVPSAPSLDVSRRDALVRLWSGAHLDAIETRTITVERTFADFDDYWTTVHGGPSFAAGLAAMTAADQDRLKTRLRERLPCDTEGRITYQARAHAVDGSVPKPR